jgi:hypothetical protein
VVQADGKPQTLSTMMVVHAAGQGNERLQSVPMQKRALHMVMVKGDLPAIWGHVIEANANPRLTITSHIALDGKAVWYVGGQIAESGTRLEASQQIAVAQKELGAVFTDLDWSQMQWATLKVNRAEQQQADGSRPVSPDITQQKNQITVWPTKLVFAPMVADEILQRVKASGLNPANVSDRSPAAIDLPKAKIGSYPWDIAEWR